MRPSAGTLIDGRYRVIEKVGSGGMADVYGAEDTHLGRKVALKILHSRFAEDHEFVERFRREASAAAGLQHPNVVGVYDRGRFGDTYYIAMEFLEGRTLKDVILAGEVTVERAVEVVQDILAATRFAHRRGVIHRDLKPQNVIVDAEGRAKVTDFGIARAGASDMTQTGSVLGTAHYLSPEQAQGLEVTEAADIYAIGVILYESLTGRLPFEGDSAVAVALKQVSEAPRPPSELNPQVPRSLDSIVLRALAKEPSHRFASADEFREELDRMTGGHPVADATAAWGAGAPTGEEVVEAPRRRISRRLVALGILVLLLAALAAWLLTRPGSVTVPTVTGMQLSEATQRLEDRGLEVDVRLVDSDAAPQLVLEQDPPPGRSVDEGSTIRLSVSRGPPEVQVPVVRGLPTVEARERIQEAGFRNVEIERRFDDQIERGRAIGTDPPARRRVERTETIVLVISRGPQDVSVPDVVGLDRSAAENAIRQAGLVPQVTTQESQADEDEVIAQRPAAGTSIEPGSTVVLVVSTGEAEVDVPDVVGRSRQNATGQLRDRGFQVTVRERDTDERREDGRVIEQSPSGGTSARRGDRVTIMIGRFVEPESPADEDAGE